MSGTKPEKSDKSLELLAESESLNLFAQLYKLDISDDIETMPGYGGKEIPYLNWAYAWHLTKTFDPHAKFKVREFNDLPYLKTEKGYFVHVTLTIKGQEESHWYAIDGSNPSAQEIENAHQRCFVKCAGKMGLGLQLWQKEKREAIQKKLALEKEKNKIPTSENSSKPHAPSEPKQKIMAEVGESGAASAAHPAKKHNPNFKINLGTLPNGKAHWLNDLTFAEAEQQQPGAIHNAYNYYQPKSFRNTGIREFLEQYELYQAPADLKEDEHSEIPF